MMRFAGLQLKELNFIIRRKIFTIFKLHIVVEVLLVLVRPLNSMLFDWKLEF